MINQSVNEFHTQLAAAALARPPDTRTAPDGVRLCNGILLSIPDKEYDVVRPHLQQVSLSLGQSLTIPLKDSVYGYFVNEGIVSLFVVSAEARSVEVATVGKEGFVGAPLAAGINRSPYHAWTRIPGVGLGVRADVLQGICTPTLIHLLNRYAQVQCLQVMQLAACNRLHKIEQRLALWLLMNQDRVDSGVLPLTHNYLAQMLGTGRPSISIAANILRDAGTIRYARGNVTILNRKSLRKAACECYTVIQHLNEELGVK